MYYTPMLRAILGAFVDILVPPRQSERLVARLAPAALAQLEAPQGLPYHNEVVAALVWEAKYHANPRALGLAAELLAPRVLECAAEEVGVPLLVPVPIHKARKRERGHNQAELLCQAMLPHLGQAAKYCPQALARTVNTAHQQGLHRDKRLHNVKNCMQANSAAVKDRVCIVVDDVTTTGATLAEAKRALLAAGARSVHTLALAYS